ncbi:MAG: hypothetical protein IKU52_06005, partial [Clostridia bacterium]|nr:hypothetical protein [Clostridia bacterium]
MKIKRIAALLLLILLLCSSCTKESEVTVESPVKTEPGIALKSEHCTITDAMFEYMFYFNFYNAYGDSTEYYNLNLDLTFTEQLYDSDISWQDHLSELALENAKNDIFLTEAALAEGFKYEELEADIEKNIENYKDSAEQVQMTFEDYLVTYFGEKATESVVRKGLEIQLFATAYGNELKNRFTSELTEEDYDDYYNEHRMEIEIVDVLVYSIPINYNGVINTEKRDSLLACKTEEEFKAWIANDLTEKNSLLENP